MSRHASVRSWRGGDLVAALASRGTLMVTPSVQGLVEQAPRIDKDVDAVMNAAEVAGRAREVAWLEPLIVVKG